MRTLALALFFATTAHAAPLPIDVEDFTLPNGLRVVLSPDHAGATVGVAVHFDVGSRSEKPAESGYAHLIEHLSCDGPSDPVGRIADLGGEASGTTTPDATVLYEEVPAVELERALWVESERMRTLPVDEALLGKVRARIQAEGRSLAGPNARAAARTAQLAYQSFAWSHATSGSSADLDRATPASVRAFWLTFYGPSNAVLTLRGDFDPKQAHVLVERYFGALPRRPNPPAPDLVDPDPTVEKYAHLRDRDVRDPLVTIAYRIPPARSADWYALDLLGAVLGAGDSARLVDRFEEQGVARSIEVGIDLDRQRGPGLLELVATAATGRTAADVRGRIDGELERVRKEGVTDRELGRARTRVHASLYGGLETHLGAAIRLGEFALLYGDPRRLRDELARYDAVTAADVARVAKTYLVPARRVVVEVDALPDPGSPATVDSPTSKSAAAVPPVAAGAAKSLADAKPPAEIKGQPEPAMVALTDVAFPSVVSQKLANGLELVVVERPGAALVDLTLLVGAGSADDPPSVAGRAALVANLLHEGTTTRTRDQLEDDIESAGGDLTTTVDAHATRIATRALVTELDHALAVLADATLHPEFSTVGIDIARSRMLGELTSAEADPSFLAARVAASDLFAAANGLTAYASIAPSRESLGALAHDDLARFHADRFHPADATLIVVGDVHAKDLAARVKKAFGAWKGAAHASPVAAELPARAATTLHLFERPSTAASWRIDFALPPNDLALLIATELLARSAKLPAGARVELDTRRLAAELTVDGRLPAGDVGPALSSLLAELTRMGKEPPAPADLTAARQRLLGRFARMAASPSGLSLLIATARANGAPANDGSTFALRLAKLDGAAVMKSAEQYLTPKRAVVVVTGAKELAPSLAPIGKLVVERK